jgi:hypothetical protein
MVEVYVIGVGEGQSLYYSMTYLLILGGRFKVELASITSNDYGCFLGNHFGSYFVEIL